MACGIGSDLAFFPSPSTPICIVRVNRIPGLREIVAHPNYIVLYRVAADRIKVVNVVHVCRQFPNVGVD